MTYLDQINTATNSDFINRVQQAAVKTAVAVSSEAASGEAIKDQKRGDFALALLHDPQKYARLLAYGVAAQGLNGASSDGQIETTISALWNAYAGV